MSAAPPSSRASLRALALLGVAAAGVAASGERPPSGESPLPSITAEHVRRHVPSGTELVRARLELAPAGLRVAERSGGRELEIVQDFVAGRLWFVDRTRRIAHEVELGALEPGEATARAPATGGLLAPVPCAGRVAHRNGEIVRHGRVLTGWSCRDADGERAALEWIDATLGIVVRRETPNGIVDELREVRERVFGEGHFSPPSRFRRVDEHELLLGAPPIEAFDESAARDASSRPARSSGPDSSSRERANGERRTVL